MRALNVGSDGFSVLFALSNQTPLNDAGSIRVDGSLFSDPLWDGVCLIFRSPPVESTCRNGGACLLNNTHSARGETLDTGLASIGSMSSFQKVSLVQILATKTISRHRIFPLKTDVWGTLHRNVKRADLLKTRHTHEFVVPPALSTPSNTLYPDKAILRAKIFELRAEGWSYREIAGEVGLHWTRVGQILKGR